MGIYYYAVDLGENKYFSPPKKFGITSPSIYHPDNPFGNMVLMMNIKGYHFVILDDCSNEIPPSYGFEDITEQVYNEYKEIFSIKILDQPERLSEKTPKGEAIV